MLSRNRLTFSRIYLEVWCKFRQAGFGGRHTKNLDQVDHFRVFRSSSMRAVATAQHYTGCTTSLGHTTPHPRKCKNTVVLILQQIRNNCFIQCIYQEGRFIHSYILHSLRCHRNLSATALPRKYGISFNTVTFK